MATSIALEHNPYIIGRPIHDKDDFFGRDELFRFISDNLNQQAQVILLHGQRRIGKSSVLSQIPHFVKLDAFVFVSLSLEGQANKALGDLLSELARDIVEQLEHHGALVKPLKTPAKSAFKNNAAAFSEEFLPKVYAALGGKNLVLLLDEFDVLEDHGADAAVDRFFPYLQSILKRNPRLYLVPVVGRRLDELPNLLNLFGRAPYQEVGLLQGKAAKDLIVKPAAGILQYEPEAIDAVLSLTAGHPYLTQVLCFAIFAHLREEERQDVTRADVEGCVDKAIELGQAGLTWFRDGLPIAERVVMTAMVQVAESKEVTLMGNMNPSKMIFAVSKVIFILLERHGVVLSEELRLAPERLYDWGYIKSINQQLKIGIKLVEYWLKKKCILENEIWELENLSQEAKKVYEEIQANDTKKKHLEQDLKTFITNRSKIDKLPMYDYESFKQMLQGFKIQSLDAVNLERVWNLSGMDRKDYVEGLFNRQIKDSIDSEKRLCHEILEINPNYFSILFRLAEIYMEEKLRGELTFSDLMPLYIRVYKIDAVKARDVSWQFLTKFGRRSILDGKFQQVSEIFENMLFIDQGNKYVRSLLELIRGEDIFDGKTFTFLRHLRQVFQFTVEEEKVIASHIKKLKLKKENIRVYEEELYSRLQNGYSHKSFSELISSMREFQILYDISHSDVELVHEKVQESIFVKKQSVMKQYQEEVNRLAIEGKLSSVARRILDRKANDLGIAQKEAHEIEERVLEPYRNMQEYEHAFIEACNEQYPLLPRTRNELRELQKVLKISPIKIKDIEAKAVAKLSYLQDLNLAASELQDMISQLSEPSVSDTYEEQTVIATKVMEELRSNPSLKERITSAFKAGSLAAIEQILNGNPIARITLAMLEASIEAPANKQ
jgi:hypothetical protein